LPVSLPPWNVNTLRMRNFSVAMVNLTSDTL
jgi:hypothetical protein